jgi:hypothetical protein
MKGLTPRTYEVRAEHEGRIIWRAALPVSPGLVTRATDVFLWPLAASSTPVRTQVDSFALSAGIPVVRGTNGALSLEGTRVPGTEVVYASNDAATLITRTNDTVYLVEKGLTGTTLNLTALFHSLKSRDLGLPGAVPLVEVRPHPFSAGKYLIVTETSLYLLDTDRIALERLATIDRIAHTAWNDTEVLLMGTDGTLTAVDLVFKTAVTAPFTPGTLTRLESTPDGDVLILLGAEGPLRVYYRASETLITVAEQVSEFALGPAGSRLAYVSGNNVALYFLGSYEGDVFVPQGTTLSLWEGPVLPHSLSWNSSLPRYLFLLADGELTTLEIGLHGERNREVLADHARSFALAGFTAYLVKDDGTLVELSFEE